MLSDNKSILQSIIRGDKKNTYPVNCNFDTIFYHIL